MSVICFASLREMRESLDDERVYFAMSRDGLYWKDLNECKPVLRSSIGTGGVRDPFIIRMENISDF